MFSLTEPSRTRFDWCFRLFGTPVRVHPFFWISILLLGGDQGDPWFTLYWVAICLVSILIHEFGHTFAMRLFGDRGQIVLWGLGGIAIGRAGNYRRHYLWDVVVSAAGPAAGLLFAVLVAAVAVALGGNSQLGLSSIGLPVWHVVFNPLHLAITNYRAYLHLHFIVNSLLWVNFYWSFVNLLPAYPLDGGQISRAIFEHRDPFTGRTRSLQLSLVVSVIVAALALFARSLYLAFFFGYLASASLQAVRVAPQRPYRRY